MINNCHALSRRQEYLKFHILSKCISISRFVKLWLYIIPDYRLRIGIVALQPEHVECHDAYLYVDGQHVLLSEIMRI